MQNQSHRQSWQFKISDNAGEDAVSYLCHHTGLSKGKIKNAMNKGAVWLQRGRRKRRRLRRATAPLRPGDQLSVFYDPVLLAIVPPAGKMLWQRQEYSLWYKPAGLLSQGNEYGDHVSLLRQAELAQAPRNQAYLVHRLDREAHGLMLIAHSPVAARKLSDMFQQRQIRKCYEVRVSGQPQQAKAEIRILLDGKSAVSSYELIEYAEESNTSTLLVQIETGRRHQIRRHLAMMGNPVLGDPQYGQGNKNTAGLQLCAFRLQFTCPFTRERRDFELNSLLADSGQVA
ncbi:MAG: RNA pseudouridine synthase [Gammaproteobacteria bacterium]|jgi:tRNA pseudouridine32 synthase / 23S rRNA pseudouridine746 synthase